MRPDLDGIEKKLDLNSLKKYLLLSKPIPESLSTIAPGVIVGERNYPRISIGVVSPVRIIDDALDMPKEWVKRKYPLLRIATIRASLIDSFSRTDIQARNRLIEKMREIALSSKPVDIDIEFKDKPVYKPILHIGVPPMGGSARIKKLEVSNPRVPRIVERIVSDTDIRAEEAVIDLWRKGIDEYYSYKLFSLGLLGRSSSRRLVPTRWSITAIDDLLAKNLLREIRSFEWVSDYKVYTGGILGNYYIALLLPSPWSYELFESYLSSDASRRGITDYVTDREGYFSRTSYASNTAGGYYAARLAVLEKLRAMKRQAAVLLIRIITPAYIFPLGVWVVREAVRKCLSSKPQVFTSLKEAISYMERHARNNYGASIMNIIRDSKIIRDRQVGLRNYLNIKK